MQFAQIFKAAEWTTFDDRVAILMAGGKMDEQEARAIAAQQGRAALGDEEFNRRAAEGRAKAKKGIQAGGGASSPFTAPQQVIPPQNDTASAPNNGIAGQQKAPKKNKSLINWAILGQTPGQTFPTIRGQGSPTDPPPVYTVPGAATTQAAKGDVSGHPFRGNQWRAGDAVEVTAAHGDAYGERGHVIQVNHDKGTAHIQFKDYEKPDVPLHNLIPARTTKFDFGKVLKGAPAGNQNVGHSTLRTKGDLPGHPFRGNQHTGEGRTELDQQDKQHIKELARAVYPKMPFYHASMERDVQRNGHIHLASGDPAPKAARTVVHQMVGRGWDVQPTDKGTAIIPPWEAAKKSDTEVAVDPKKKRKYLTNLNQQMSSDMRTQNEDLPGGGA